MEAQAEHPGCRGDILQSLQALARFPNDFQPWPPKHTQGSLVATIASTIKSVFSMRLYKACTAESAETPLLWDSALDLALSPMEPRSSVMLGGGRAGYFLFQH